MTEFELGPLVESLGWTLIHFVWQGAAVGLIFALLMRACRHTSPNLRYVIGLVCMCALLLLPIATYWYVYQSGQVGNSQSLMAAGPALLGQAIGAASAIAANQSWLVALETYISAYLPWIVMAWGFGVALLSLRVCLGWWRLEKLSREGVSPLAPELQQQVAVLCDLLGVRQSVTVLESTRVGVPTVMGWLKPVILMPTSCLLGLSREQLELVIAHELGHIRRWDYLVNLLQVLVETVLFYHPVVRWISRRVREEREQCCDDLVLRHCGKPVQYAKALANLETIRGGWLEPALAATGGQLVTRIERIVGGRPASRTSDVLSGNSLVLGIIVAVVVVLSQLNQRPIEQVMAKAPIAAPQLSEELAASQPVGDKGAVTSGPTFSAAPTPTLLELPVTAAREQRLDVIGSDSPQKSVAAPDQPSTLPTQIAVGEVGKEADAALTPNSPGAAVTVAAAESKANAPVVSAREQKISAGNVAPEPLTEMQVASARSVALPVSQATEPAGPVALKRVAPNYPRRARVSGLQGAVTVEFSVGHDGSVRDIFVVESHPRRVFDKEAKRAISKWAFDPATVTNTQARLTQVFQFNLNSGIAAAPPQGTENYRTCNRITGTRICLEDEF